MYYADSFGIFVDDKLKAEKVILRAYSQQAKFVETPPLHHSQQVIGSGEGYTDYSYSIRITHNFVRELMSKCGDIEILEPKHLIKDMQSQALAILKRYKQDKIESIHNYSVLKIKSFNEIKPYMNYCD